MDNKKNILESWIMVEHLSEGDISLRERGNVTLNELQDDNYYRLMEETMRKSSAGKYDKRGIVVYFDIFPFAEVIDFLRNKYNLPEPEEKVKVGNKFSFALCFDKNLKLNSELTFLTESYYIRKYREIPTESEFFKFEKRYRKRFQEMFDYSDEATYEEHFNTTMASIMMKYKVDTKNCRMKVLRNLETEAANMHSFFVRDLQNAKKIRSEKLDDYILGRQKNRVNLDTRAESNQFNPDAITDILQPKNYPLGRFPGNPKHAPALMQQVAINLATDYDNDQMRSVNGPPGTGKTTLLKDIFAELVVEQAFEIAQLPEKHMKGSEKTRYWNYAAIGVLPERIAENGILVASSNNGAVQNIVNELPLLKEIDEEFRKSLLDADYFTEIANSVVEKTLDSEDVSTNGESDTGVWGLFSLEGGKKQNMWNINVVMKKVADYLKNEYVPNPDVYDDYITKYQEVRNYRQERQNLADQRTKLPQLEKELERKREQYPVEKKAKEAAIAAHRKTYEEKLLELEKQMFDIANQISYGGNMVQGKKENGAAKWFDIGGTATDKYVPEQGRFLREMIQRMIEKNPDIIDKEKPDTIYVISPFKNVAFQLSRELYRIGFTRYEKGKPTNVGTVHTFQGKEAPIVFLVLGADWNSKGAANWAMGSDNPNIMNVAATRAKEQFYIIGDQKLYRSLNSEVINDTVEIIEKFNGKSEE